MYSGAVKKLIEQFEKLPSIGPKSAERFVFFLLESGRGEVERLRLALDNLLKTIATCGVCQNFSDSNPCAICRDTKRAGNVVCVVAFPSTVEAIEKSGRFKGRYHVLRGLINPAHEISEDKIKIKELIERVKNNKEGIKEIILALNPDIDGETTAIAIARELKGLNVNVTKLARGLPLGSDIEYADDITLGEALTGRKQI